ncbi:putative cytochrome P450 52E1 [Rosellinia necatrix]|uniref:Putative cytochrome P450 52E1 n=1 Tax=Rosellinia necatrix TaxID=77044 RepID=A0A1W2TUI5_ROSNE|nr:putative cytochrome P450 52E1 [Rosellinia necatrix]
MAAPLRGNLDSVPRAARLWYYGAALLAAALATGWLVRVPLAVPVLLALYAFGPLRAEHAYHERAALLGCRPAPRYPARDLLGLRYMFETAASLRGNVMLQRRAQVLATAGHTFVHGIFPDWADCVTTDEPENVKAVLATRFADWNLPAIRIKSFLPVLGAHSIFTTNGAEWQHSRAILRPAFVRDQISDLACVDRHVQKLILRKIPADGKTVFDMQAMLSMLTTDSISDFMFGRSTDLLGDAPPASHRFGAHFDTAMQKIAWRARLGWLTLLRSDPELEEGARAMRAFVRGFVDDVKRERADPNSRRGDGHKYVFLDELLKSGESDEVIRDHLLSIFTAGRDTTTSVLSYLFFELSRRPDVVAAIRAEIEALGTPDPTWEDLRGMRYLNWVLKEALRLNPPVAANQREAVRDTVLPVGGGADGKAPLFVRKGTNLRYVPWIMHRRKDIFGEDAEEFRPERWEDLRVTYEYLPFNAGPRICIGQQFALTQMALITFRLLQAFKAIERRDDRPPIQKLGINLSMLYGCLVSVTPA